MLGGTGEVNGVASVDCYPAGVGEQQHREITLDHLTTKVPLVGHHEAALDRLGADQVHRKAPHTGGKWLFQLFEYSTFPHK